jgi:quinol monooxygenase YgiN
MYGLFGKMKTHPGQRDAMLQHMLTAAALMPDIVGCHIYVVGSDPNDPDGIWVNEVWRSQADHQASLSHEAVQNLIAEARPLIAGFSDRVEYTPLGGQGLPDNA